jgi:phosphopantothenoylcysteine decarboxylase/phosphopantothenate--cysteine ligase
VADWTPAQAAGLKLKKDGKAPPALALVETTDILARLSANGTDRPRLVVGFAAETNDVLANAQAKLARKGCDWIVANDVSTGTGTFGGTENQVTLVRRSGHVVWPRLDKEEIGRRLAAEIADSLKDLA